MILTNMSAVLFMIGGLTLTGLLLASLLPRWRSGVAAQRLETATTFVKGAFIGGIGVGLIVGEVGPIWFGGIAVALGAFDWTTLVWRFRSSRRNADGEVLK